MRIFTNFWGGTNSTNSDTNFVGSREDAAFYCLAVDHCGAYWNIYRGDRRDVPWKDIFNPGASAATSEFCEWFRF